MHDDNRNRSLSAYYLLFYSHGRDGKVNIWSIEEGQELNNSTTVSDIGFCPISLLEIGM